jgi:hypothetical protein
VVVNRKLEEKVKAKAKAEVKVKVWKTEMATMVVMRVVLKSKLPQRMVVTI